MIKEVTNKQKETKEIGFPKFMVGTKGTIILATSISIQGIIGVVIKKGQGEYSVGDYDTDWSTSAFTDYNEPITLQNVTE